MSATTFSELWVEVKEWAQEEVAALVQAGKDLEHYIEPVIEAEIVQALSQLKAIAIASVIEVAQEAMSGEEKFGTVVTKVFQHAEAQAIQVAIEDVRVLVQQAYTALATSLKETGVGN